MAVQHYQAKSFRGRTSVGYLLRSANLVLVGHLDEVMTRHGLTSTQWIILMHLRDGLVATATDLCERLRYDSGALTRVIDQLEARGWVQRQRSEEDRRSVSLSLTEAGRAATDALIPEAVERLNWSLRHLSRTELAELTRLLTKVIGSGEAKSP